MKTSVRGTRSRLLGGVGTIVLAMLSTAAQAAPASTAVTDPVSPAATTVGHVTATSEQLVDAPVSAEVSDVSVTIDGVEDDGLQIGEVNDVSANLVQANGMGNTYASQVDLSLINSTIDPDPEDDPLITPTAHGAAALGVQLTGAVGITSDVDGNSIAIDRPGFQSGSATATENTIEAIAGANDSRQLIAGVTPNDYISDAQGSSTLDFPSLNLFQAEGSVVVSTVQGAQDTAVSATAGEDDGNIVALTLTADGANTVQSAPAVEGNSIASTTRVNSARNTIDLQSGANPTFTGSAVVSNIQDNTGGNVTQSASNSGGAITAVVYGNDDGDVNTLTGSLSVSDNTISSSATGNQATGGDAGSAGNRILIDGVSIDGAGASGTSGASIAYASGDLTQTAGGDLVINSSQSNTGVALRASTDGAPTVTAQVQSVDGGSVDLDGDTVAATVSGNAVSSAIASDGSAAQFAGSTVLANQQINLDVVQSADVIGALVVAVTGTDDGVTHDSSVSVANNTTSATGYGASAAQNLSLDANTLDVGAGEAVLTAGTAPDGNVSAQGGAVIANLQSSYDSSLDVSQEGSQVGLDADSRGLATGGSIISGGTLSTTANTQESVAVANSGANSLLLAGTNLGSGAGIASEQILDDDSSASASLGSSRVGLIASTHIADSQLETSGNLQRAIAYGGSVSNTLDMEANGLTLDPDAISGSTVNYIDLDTQSFSGDAANLPVVTAAFGILSDQSSQGDVVASAVDSSVGVSVEGDVNASSVSNTANSYVAAAYGNDAANGATLDLGDVDAGGFASIAAVANTQAAGDTASSISATASGSQVVLTAIEDNVANSSVTTSSNLIQALAVGNRSTGSTLAVSGNNIEAVSPTLTGVTAAAFGGDAMTLAATSTLSVQNAQAAHGAITASQEDNPLAPTTTASVLTTIGTSLAGTGDVDNATVASDGNRLLASATGNSGQSGLSVEANELAASTGVQNFQASDADLSALIGLPGSEGFDAFNVSANITDGSATGNILGLSADQRAAFVATYSSQDDWTYNPITGDFSYSVVGIGAVSLPVAGTAGTPNQGGVTIAVNGGISGSRLSVDNNAIAGSVTGNSAANGLAIDTTSIASAGGVSTARAGLLETDILDNETLGVEADHSLANFQHVGSSTLVSAVSGAFALDAVDGAGIDNSTLSVSGNGQSATAVANTAANTLALAANEVSAESGLLSVQTGEAAVSASSNMEVFAPTASEASSVSLSNNTNRSLAVMNDATNKATISATIVAPVGPTSVATLATSTSVLADGDHVLVNQQGAFETVQSAATTYLHNDEQPADVDLGVSNGSVTVAGNITTAEAAANQASNSLALNGLSSQAASAGVANLQTSSSDVDASATSDVGIALAGDVQPALSNGSVSLSGNATTALAHGNMASNALNVAADGGYGSAVDEPAGSTLFSLAGGAAVNARAGALNEQLNTGAVSAQSTGVTYTVALNADAAPGLSGSSVSVSNNRVGAQAYGNSANNTVTVAALNTGTPTTAVANHQLNTGAITARSVTVTIGAVSSASTAGTLRAAGNQVTATAVGNSAVSTLTAAK